MSSVTPLRRSARLAARAAMAAQPVALQAKEKAAKTVYLPSAADLKTDDKHERRHALKILHGFLMEIATAPREIEKLIWTYELLNYLCHQGSTLFSIYWQVRYKILMRLGVLEANPKIQMYPGFPALIQKTREVIRANTN